MNNVSNVQENEENFSCNPQLTAVVPSQSSFIALRTAKRSIPDDDLMAAPRQGKRNMKRANLRLLAPMTAKISKHGVAKRNCISRDGGDNRYQF